jgi:DNA-binding NarL/FixJ family response regulator
MAMRGRHRARCGRLEPEDARYVARDPAQPNVRFLIVHPLPVVRRGLVSILSAMGSGTVGEVSTAAQAREWLAGHEVDIVLVASMLADGSGFDLVGLPDRRGRAPAWVVVAATGSAALVAEALRRGAAGLLVASADVDEIVRVVGKASRGEPTFTPGQLAAAREAAGRHLSPRERGVVRLLAAGRSNDEIAAAFAVSRRTIETYLTRLYRRFEVSSRVELVNRLRADGLLGDGDPAPAESRDPAVNGARSVARRLLGSRPRWR